MGISGAGGVRAALRSLQGCHGHSEHLRAGVTGGQSFTTRLTSPKQVNPWLWLCWLLPSGHEPFESRNDLICLVQRKRVTPRLRDCTPGHSSGEEPLCATGQFPGALTRFCSLVCPSYLLLLCAVQSETTCGS